MMNPGINFELKPRNIKLVPNKCVAIGLRRSNSPIISTFSSSLSMSSERDHMDNHHHHHRHNRQNDQQQQSNQSPILDKISMVSTTTTSTNTTTTECLCQRPFNCLDLFNELIKENTCLSSSINSLCKINLVGFTYPGTLIVTSGQDTLETLCSLWSKRILKAPPGYIINFVGYTNILEVSTISQSHFTPLAEALYRCIDELNTMRINANLDTIIQRLCSEFPSMELPSEDILKTTLHTMTTDNRLNYDVQKQVFTAVHQNNFLLPWEEFESLSISDNNTRSNKDEDIVTNDNCSEHRNSTFVITDDDYSDCITNNNNGKKNLMRRNSSSLSNDETTDDSKRNPKTNFRRSKSFKLNHKPNQNENNDIDRKCTCSDILIKRQSLLGKLFKFNSSYSKGNQRSSSLMTTNPLLRDFGSQFPEGINNNSIVMFNNNYNKPLDRFISKGTQTVKSGPEEIITVVMRQVGKHALSRKRGLTKEKIINQEGSCFMNRWPRYKCSCESTISKQRDNNGIINTKKIRHRNVSSQISSSSNECHRCFNESNMNQIDSLLSKNSKRERKQRNTSSMRQQQRSNKNNWIDYIDNSNGHFCRHENAVVGNHNHNHSNNGNHLMKKDLFCKKATASHIDYHLNDLNSREKNIQHQRYHHNLDKCWKLLNLEETTTMPCNLKNELYPIKINECAHDNDVDGDDDEDDDDGDGGHDEDSTEHRNMQETNGSHLSFGHNNKHHYHHQVQSHGNLLINNSLSVKIEIETSNISPNIVHQHNSSSSASSSSLDPMSQQKQQHNKINHLLNQNKPQLMINCNLDQPNHTNTTTTTASAAAGAIFTNGTYSQFDFGNDHHSMSDYKGQSNVFEYKKNAKHRYANHPELNYANSITALKEQIARAKANFFKESFAS